MLLGCIADDFTGASDLGNTLTRAGMRCVQYTGLPEGDGDPEVAAGIIALKMRSAPAAEAVAQARKAADWLRAQGCGQILYKYCSTFDSTPKGNIGPVTEALAADLGAQGVIMCPAFPATGRTVYQGHLFVHDRLLSESGLEQHPLNPMTDPDIRRWLARQTAMPVGHLPHAVVARGADAARSALGDSSGLVIADAISEADLVALGHAADGAPLITGGSGIAMGLPDNFRAAGQLAAPPDWRGVAGPVAALSGSCSAATREQVAAHAAEHPAREVTAEEVTSGAVTGAALADWLLSQPGVPLAYSSADPETVAAAQARHGAAALAAAIEALFADTARALRDRGVARLIVAGGETSGAVVEGLGLGALEIGPEIDPGVPAMRAGDLALALKSGNFGGRDFFARAARQLGDEA